MRVGNTLEPRRRERETVLRLGNGVSFSRSAPPVGHRCG
ncbi:hypothetical protein I552_5401 [Mycobacterium xenopi 3993]|nr:hypothetical protein I552_5401 [Mycobacterium xenopi 3993]